MVQEILGQVKSKKKKKKKKKKRKKKEKKLSIKGQLEQSRDGVAIERVILN